MFCWADATSRGWGRARVCRGYFHSSEGDGLKIHPPLPEHRELAALWRQHKAPAAGPSSGGEGEQEGASHTWKNPSPGPGAVLETGG